MARGAPTSGHPGIPRQREPQPTQFWTSAVRDGASAARPERPGLMRPCTWALPSTCLLPRDLDRFSLFSRPPALCWGQFSSSVTCGFTGRPAGSVHSPPPTGCAEAGRWPPLGPCPGLPHQERARTAPSVPAGQQPGSTQSGQWAPRPPAWICEVPLWV